MTEEEGALLEAPFWPATTTAADSHREQAAGDVAGLGYAVVAQTAAVVLTAGRLPRIENSDAALSDLPNLSGSFHLPIGAPRDPAFGPLLDAVLGPALGSTDTALDHGVLDEGLPPLRWQVTEDEGFQQDPAVLCPAPPVFASAVDTTLGRCIATYLHKHHWRRKLCYRRRWEKLPSHTASPVQLLAQG
jgi:hypothetical protein